MVRKRKVKKLHNIDGCVYSSDLLFASHIQLNQDKKDNIIKSFELPQHTKAKIGRYSAYKPIIDGIRFDSMMEGLYYVYLLKLIKSKEILSFTRQVSYELQPGFKLNNHKISSIKYVADFVIQKNKKEELVVDVKGKETADFKIKKKMFEYKYKKNLYCVQYYSVTKEWLTLEEIKKLKHKK